MTASSQSLSLGSPLLQMVSVDVASSKHSDASAVRGVNWTVEPLQFWVIGGGVGTGKTDFLETAAGVSPPRQGSLRLCGIEWEPSAVERRIPERLKVGLVHDGGILMRHLTTAENVALPLQYHDNLSLEEASDRTLAWLDATEMTSFANVSAAKLGRIWGQRASLARACILNPELLLLDNPLTGLDPTHLRWWLNTLELLHKGHPLLKHRPLTIVVTCDEFRPWLKLGTHFAVLSNGIFRIVDRMDAERGWEQNFF